MLHDTNVHQIFLALIDNIKSIEKFLLLIFCILPVSFIVIVDFWSAIWLSQGELWAII